MHITGHFDEAVLPKKLFIRTSLPKTSNFALPPQNKVSERGTDRPLNGARKKS